jgi:hypothetical protein
MDDYLMAPTFDGYEDAGHVMVDTGRVEPYISPENIEDYVATRSTGGVA